MQSPLTGATLDNFALAEVECFRLAREHNKISR